MQREPTILTLPTVFIVVPLWLTVPFAAILGAVVGSFLGAALIRLPKGESVVAGRSRCDVCGRVLGPAELVPVFSYLVLRGRCRACQAPIDPWQFAAETGGALAGLVCALVARDAVMLGIGLVLGWQLLLLGLLDLRHMWLPDRLIGLLAASGMVPAGLAAAGDANLLAGPLLGAALGFVLLWLPGRLYRAWRGRDGLGAGDPKLLAAMGVWLGPLGVVETLLGASLIGLVAAGALMLSGKAVGLRSALPLGSCLALAGFAVYLAQN
ncbi:MAG: prepilin peptidase [Novosphingobium sp.]|nr:prepilin peptidase [Novosphingobium sp.]